MKRVLSILFSVVMIAGCAPKKTLLVRRVAEALPKSVMVYVPLEVTMLGKPQPDAMVMGTGVFISPRGHILTCNHLLVDEVIAFFGTEIGRAKHKNLAVVVQYNGDTQAAEILSVDPAHDLALLKIETTEPTPYARIADPRTLEAGQEVFAVGNPEGLDFSVTHGIISALTRDLPTGYNLIQTDTPINPGNSGGPLFNMAGELVGINNSAMDASDGLGFAINPAQIIEFIVKFATRYDGLPKLNSGYWRT